MCGSHVVSHDGRAVAAEGSRPLGDGANPSASATVSRFERCARGTPAASTEAPEGALLPVLG